jgi:hypothetical protein
MIDFKLAAAFALLMSGGIAHAKDFSFGAPVVLNGQAFIDDVVLADLDGDGRQDFCMLLEPRDTGEKYVLSIRYGRADGSFAPARNFDMGVTQRPGQLLTGDFDGDGDLDVAVFLPVFPEIVLMKNEDGAFTALSRPVDGHPRQSAHVADVDSDGDSDIVVNGNGNTVTVFRGDEGAYLRQDEWVQLAGSVDTLSVGKFDNDEFADIAYPIPGGVHVQRGRADGFAQNSSYVVHTTPGVSPELKIADLTGDGLDDLLVKPGDDYYASMRFHFPDGNGGFRPAKGKPVRIGYIKRIHVVDMDGDGIVDIFEPQASPWGQLRFGLGNGRFTRETVFGIRPWVLDVSDVNGDGLMDLLESDGSDYVLRYGTRAFAGVDMVLGMRLEDDRIVLRVENRGTTASRGSTFLDFGLGFRLGSASYGPLPAGCANYGGLDFGCYLPEMQPGEVDEVVVAFTPTHPVKGNRLEAVATVGNYYQEDAFPANNVARTSISLGVDETPPPATPIERSR